MKKNIIIFFLLMLVLTSCGTVDLNAPAPIFDTGIDPNSWATIPAGEFLSGQFDSPTNIEYEYEIMITDVTNAQYADFLNSALQEEKINIEENMVSGYYPGDEFNQGRHEEQIDAGDYIYIPLDNDALRIEFNENSFNPKTEWANHPMTMVSWFGAKAYCEYYGWRLPSELEWEKAARGTDNRPFPWGSSIERDNANYLSSRDPFEDMGSFGSRTTPVGFYNGNTYDGYQTIDSASSYGLYDMAGNVWQWTSDIYPQQHYRYMRGGSKESYENSLRIWMRNNATPVFTSPSVGFRCVR